jgi:hypothetical protein
MAGERAGERGMSAAVRLLAVDRRHPRSEVEKARFSGRERLHGAGEQAPRAPPRGLDGLLPSAAAHALRQQSDHEVVEGAGEDPRE